MTYRRKNNEIDNNVIKSLSIYFMEADLNGTRIRLNLRQWIPPNMAPN
jgi:hypothetical protein